ncbi:MAG TPA: A/G-specific adenine glycosylase [Phycisphaerae bacterium]|nr:A/G-specific adenine glycosylase [Phycisphaerae bacterium]
MSGASLADGGQRSRSQAAPATWLLTLRARRQPSSASLHASWDIHMSRGLPAARLPHANRIRTFRDQLLGWYRENGRNLPWRNRSATRYELILAEVLLQRTRAETVASFFGRFVRAFPSWRRLSGASEEDLQGFLQPIGLWRRRTASLQRLAGEMASRRGQFPSDRGAVESLPGIGQYIANAVLLFCHGQPQPLLDVNMARVLERHFGQRKLADIRYDPYLQRLASKVVFCEDPVSINWAVIDLAALVCTQRSPKCSTCPLVRGCREAGGLPTLNSGGPGAAG